ncbi:hypothetical protein [Acetobacter nitrogenifigens]|uniref:hypothetical protein n=1 Tax=Acetobacter nitrogenifigens TaxID=285268 RepID=UPI00047A1769|nr:hypothetical protein [Acetobacter nitrogenifigens]
MTRSVAEIVADVDATVERLEAYCNGLSRKPVAYTYSDRRPPEENAQDEGLSLPARARLPAHPPRPSGVVEPFLAPAWEGERRGGEGDEALICAQPDWLYHVLIIDGPEETMVRFRAAAAGSGRIPWARDVFSAEDLAAALPTATGPAENGLIMGLSRQTARSQAKLMERDGSNGEVPFDLNALCPAPLDILSLGPASRDAQAWLWRHWGTSRPLRQVEAVMAPPDDVGRVWAIGFWSADWTPWAALRGLATEWPDLRFFIRPLYDV